MRESGSIAAEGQFNAVFLDLNLPGKSGTEVLADMKSDLSLASIPVAILTGSDDRQDRETCASLGSDAYFSKALAMQDFPALITVIDAFLTKVRDGRAGLNSPELPLIFAA